MTDLTNYRGQLPYDWGRATKTMLDLADELGRSGFHHLPDFAEAMRQALGKAHTSFLGNNGGETLKALGAFWDMFHGRLDAHPEYTNRDAVIDAGRKDALEQAKKYLEASKWQSDGKTYSQIIYGETVSVTLPETSRSPDYVALLGATVVTLSNVAQFNQEHLTLAQIKRAGRV